MQCILLVLSQTVSHCFPPYGKKGHRCSIQQQKETEPCSDMISPRQGLLSAQSRSKRKGEVAGRISSNAILHTWNGAESGSTVLPPQSRKRTEAKGASCIPVCMHSFEKKHHALDPAACSSLSGKAHAHVRNLCMALIGVDIRRGIFRVRARTSCTKPMHKSLLYISDYWQALQLWQ
jgi:hypothetical protein